MQVNVALQRLIIAKSARNEVIHLTKVKQGIGKLDLTIGRGSAPNTYSVWQYSKNCRCGEKVVESGSISVARFLQELCGNAHLKENLPLHQYNY